MCPTPLLNILTTFRPAPTHSELTSSTSPTPTSPKPSSTRRSLLWYRPMEIRVDFLRSMDQTFLAFQVALLKRHSSLPILFNVRTAGQDGHLSLLQSVPFRFRSYHQALYQSHQRLRSDFLINVIQGSQVRWLLRHRDGKAYMGGRIRKGGDGMR